MKNLKTPGETRNFLGFQIKLKSEQLRKWAINKIYRTLKTDSN
jgi:hypothetical protein